MRVLLGLIWLGEIVVLGWGLQGADVVILGCTELSYAEEMDPETEFPVVDSQSTIIDRTIELAKRQKLGQD